MAAALKEGSLAAVRHRIALHTRKPLLEHDPEKWKPVFPRDKRKTRLRGDHAQTEGWDHDAIPLNRIM